MTVLEAPCERGDQHGEARRDEATPTPRFPGGAEARGGALSPVDEAPGLRPLRVLIADDEPVVREAIADLIRFEPGLELVGEAVDAEQSIELARRLRPDVLLIDVRMPAGGGLRVAHEVSAWDQAPRIVAWSAYHDVVTTAQMLAAGASSCLGKGVPVEEILDAIRAGQPPS